MADFIVHTAQEFSEQSDRKLTTVLYSIRKYVEWHNLPAEICLSAQCGVCCLSKVGKTTSKAMMSHMCTEKWDHLI